MNNNVKITSAEVCTIRLIRLCMAGRTSISENSFDATTCADGMPITKHIRSLKKKGVIKITDGRISVE